MDVLTMFRSRASHPRPIRRRWCATLVAAALVGLSVSAVARQAGTPTTPVPRPFPGASAPSPVPARAPEAPPETPPAPAAEILGPVPVYPSAEFIGDYDAGRGQRYYLYGSNAPFADVVTYYRNTLRNGGREIYKTPAIHQFDAGRFDEDQMAYPPGVVVKDYAATEPVGYLVAAGLTEKRFRTIIQIVPPPAAR